MKKHAEARIGGILRGGIFDTETKEFLYHIPVPVIVGEKECTDLKFTEVTKKEMCKTIIEAHKVAEKKYINRIKICDGK